MTILYPTRGGEKSHPNQDFVINLAKERGADILFLYVSDIRFLGRTGAPIVVDIEEELVEVGDFLLSMAQERAKKAGVVANVEVRSGIFSSVLREVIVKHEIKTVILGSSSKETGLVSHDKLRELSSELSQELDVEFIVVQDGVKDFST